MRRSLFVLLTVTLLGCGQTSPVVITPSPTTTVLEQDLKQAKKDIAALQAKVRALLEKMVDEIQHDNIDARKTAAEVRKTIDEVKKMKESLQKLQGKPSTLSSKGPVT